MAYGVHEAEVLRRVDEVAEAGERAPGVGEGEVDGVSGRQDAERDQEEHVGGDEGEAGPALPVGAAGAPPGRTGRGVGRGHWETLYPLDWAYLVMESCQAGSSEAMDLP